MDKHNRKIYYWLISGCVLISLMVVVGGITRLTHSGLSMVEWKPIVGAIPPLNEKEWLIEFEKYKASPEYKVYHSYFKLSDFKAIFFWEYLHRLLGRIIGLVFIVPCVIFWLKKQFSKELKRKVFIIFLFGLLQGILGWFMVKSGLVKIPHVSHYRLAAHLITALFLIAYIYHTALGVKYGVRQAVQTNALRKMTLLFLGFLMLQITYGSFVAGLKAGFVYNTFPMMESGWLPSDFGSSLSNKGWISFLENGGFVQFTHRILAFLVLILATVLYRKAIIDHYPIKVRNITFYLLLAIGIQVILGIVTLVFKVPVYLGVAHQLMAIVLVLITIRFLFFLRSLR